MNFEIFEENKKFKLEYSTYIDSSSDSSRSAFKAAIFTANWNKNIADNFTYFPKSQQSVEKSREVLLKPLMLRKQLNSRKRKLKKLEIGLDKTVMYFTTNGKSHDLFSQYIPPISAQVSKENSCILSTIEAADTIMF